MGTTSTNIKLIYKENLQSLQFKYSLIGHLADVINDLVVSPQAFERDFEEHIKRLFQVKTNLIKKDYSKYEASLISKRERARTAMKSNK